MENVTPKRLGKSFIQRFLWSVLLLCAVAMADTSAPMELIYRTSAANQTITLPLYGSVNVHIDWGDGQTEAKGTGGNVTHAYSSIGDHTVKITGSLEHFGTGYSDTDNDELISVISFGELGLKSLAGAFFKATNLISVPGSLPSTVTEIYHMFYDARSFNQDISGWDVSNVTSMTHMFCGAKSFNQDISGWDVSNVTDMTGMFYDATSFNQDIGNWNVSKVIYMTGMFCGATSFNQDISGWDVSNVKSMFSMLYGVRSFDQDIGKWNVASVTDMHGMLDSTGLSVENYDALLLGWSKQALQNNVTLGAAGVKYTQTAAHDKLTSASPQGFNWTIEGDVTIQTITFADMNNTYGDVPFFPTATASSGLAITYASSNDAVATVANGQIVIKGVGAATITASQGGNRAFAPASATATLTVSAKEVTITGITANDKTYDGTTDVTLRGGILEGLVANDIVNIVSGIGAFASKNVGVHSVSTSGYSISGSDAANYALTVQPSVSNAQITPRVLTITGISVADKTYDGTTNATLSGGILEGLVANDIVNIVSGTGAFASKNVGVQSVSTSGYSISGSDAANYTLTVQPSVSNAQITPLDLTITVDAKSKTAGEADPALTYAITNGALLSGDALAGALTRENGETANTYAILQGTLSAGANYAITYVGANLTIADKANPILDFAGNSAFSMQSSLQGKRLQVQMQNSQGPVQISVYDIHGNAIAQASSYNSAMEFPVDAGAGQRLYVVAKDAKGRTLSSQRMWME